MPDHEPFDPLAKAQRQWEALRLLAFTRTGSLPMGKLGVRLMVHPSAVTEAIGKLEQRGLVRRSMSHDDRRVLLGWSDPAGRTRRRSATRWPQLDPVQVRAFRLKVTPHGKDFLS